MGWDAEEDLRAIWEAALGAVDPSKMPARYFPPRPKGRLIAAGAGKGAGRMALAAEAHYGAALEGLVVTPPGYDQPTKHLRCLVASHPVPDDAGSRAAADILALVQDLGRDDLLLVLLSGGASALLALPAEGVSLADKQAVTRALLASGAAIDEINCVRKHLSRIKGGRLAAAAFPARTVTLAISDVPGDAPAVIGSGPTVADPTTLADARAVLEKYGIDAPAGVRTALEDLANESVKPGDPRIANAGYQIVARPADALEAGAAAARAAGYETTILGDALEGEARGVAREHAHRVAALARAGRKAALLSGGELTVTGAGEAAKGGRCREYLLALADTLGDQSEVAALAADTDGIDGTKDAAGAFLLPGDFARAQALGLDARAMLDAHRSGDYFAALGGALVTGPTGTNVGDFRVILVNPHK